MLTKLEYLKRVGNIRKKICRATCEDLILIENDLQELAEIKPIRLVYFLAQAEFMLKKGLPKDNILRFLREKAQLYYPEKKIREFFSLYSDLLPENDLIGKENCRFQVAVYDNGQTEKFYSSLEAARENFLCSPDNMDYLKVLAEKYYVTQNKYLYLLAMLLWGERSRQDGAYEQYVRSDILDLPNVGYLMELLKEGKSHTFIVVVDAEHSLEDCEVTRRILEMLGQSVYVLGPMVACGVENEMTPTDTLIISLDNVEQGEQGAIFHPIQLLKKGKVVGDNRGAIITHILEQYANPHLATIFCAERVLDELQAQRNVEYPMQRVTEVTSEFFHNKIALAWAGDYLSYISRIYQFDAAEKVTAAPECEFSIVVPARNSSATLRFTLQTCLEQRFQGSYEIVLSDNSSDGNTAIYDLYCELKHPRIRYVKPPRELPLVKSFEFAFLQAKGEFIFSIGSDDGVLPWALDVLKTMLKQYPEEDLFLWQRGFYAWPGFNGGQQHQFVIPSGKFFKENFPIGKVPTTQFLEMTFQNAQFMYSLPCLYINSGLRKRYMKKILGKTGVLWAGVCQDICMGVLNCAINKEILFLQYPLTIAGMSGSSIGCAGSKVQDVDFTVSAAMKQRYQYRSYGAYMYSRLECHLPLIGLDPMPFYQSVLHVVGTGPLAEKWLDMIDWEKVYMEMASKLSIHDALLERKLGYFRYAAQLISREMSEFVEKNICKPLLRQIAIRLPLITTEVARAYKVCDGKDGNGIVLDASEYGVEDIHGAVKLFERITGL